MDLKMMSQEEIDNQLKKLHEIENDIKTLISDKKSKIQVLNSDIDDYGTMTIQLSGGLNGNGKWKDYFESLANVSEQIGEKYNLWLIRMINDISDDIFYATFGIEEKIKE